MILDFLADPALKKEKEEKGAVTVEFGSKAKKTSFGGATSAQNELAHPKPRAYLSSESDLASYLYDYESMHRWKLWIVLGEILQGMSL